MHPRSRSGLPVLLRVVKLVLVLGLLAGLAMWFYPTIGSLWNSCHQTRAIITYTEQVSGMDEAVLDALWESAVEYNRALLENGQKRKLSPEEQALYEQQLSVDAKGTMGYIEIPAIGVFLPIYHGVSEAVLQEGAGHLEGNSLPVGGEGSHTAVSGHSGLPSARLFTDLEKLEEGDRFYLHVLGRTLAYEIDQILTVEPEELEPLKIRPKEDLCTLVTCTPYGINTHRLLVRGSRTAEPETGTGDRKAAEEPGPDRSGLGMGIAAAVLFLALCWLWRSRKKRRR